MMNTTTPSSTQTIGLYPFRFEQYIVTWISALISTIFTGLNFIRCFRYKYQRTHLTYVYHFSLGFSLLLSLMSTPLQTLTDYFWSVLPSTSVQQHKVLCNFNLIAAFVASAGIGYSIAYASLEQSFFIFHSQHIRLTWIRQFTPFLVIFSTCSIVITLLVLLSQCPLENSSCLFCYFDSVTFHVIWVCLQFVFPFLLMITAMILLVYRIELYITRIRISINRKRSRQKFQRTLIHLNIFNLFYILALCPISIYSFVRLILNTRQFVVEIFLLNYLSVSLHSYPIFVFLLTQVKQQKLRVHFHQEQKQTPFIIITRPSVQVDEYDRTRL